MALTLIAQPDKHHPAYNPVVYAVSSSASALLPGFRFVYEVFTAGSLTPFATFRVAPVLPSSGGYLDISKILQNKITNTLSFDSITTLAPFGESHFKYDLKISEEYAYYWNFVDYEDWYGYWVTLTSPIYSPSTNPALIEPGQVLNLFN